MPAAMSLAYPDSINRILALIAHSRLANALLNAAVDAPIPLDVTPITTDGVEPVSLLVPMLPLLECLRTQAVALTPWIPARAAEPNQADLR